MSQLSPNETRDYYDSNASMYDHKTGFSRKGGQHYNYARYYAPFLEREVPRSGEVLELGCGTGFYSRWLAQRGLSVCAVDISSKMIELARQNASERIEWFVGNCEDPGAILGERAAGGFDAIIGINTFSYYANKLTALENYHRLLRPDGRLIMLDMNGTSLTQHLAYLLNHRGARRFAKNINQSTPGTLASMLAQTGFRSESMKRATFMPNEVGPRREKWLMPIDRLLSVLPWVDVFAFRIYWVARKV